MDNLGRVFLSAEDYALSCNITKHEKDGEQQFQISFLAWSRLSVLETQLTSVFPNLNTHYFSLIPLGVGVLTSIVAPIAKNYLLEDGYKTNHPVLAAICEIAVHLGEAGKQVCQNANTIINTACCVSFVAMIAFGHPIPGAMGLASVMLILVKRKAIGCEELGYLYMPIKLERALDPFIFMASTMAVWSLPIYGAVRNFKLFEKFGDGIDLMKRFETTQRFLPECILNPIPGKHIKGEPVDEASIEELIDDQNNFEVNFSHIYNHQVSKLLPPDYHEEVDSLNLTNLIDKVQETFINLYKMDRNAIIQTLDGLLEHITETAGNQSKQELIKSYLVQGKPHERMRFFDLLNPAKAKRVQEVFKGKDQAKRLNDRINDEDDYIKLQQAAKMIAIERLENLIKGFLKFRSGVEYGTEGTLPQDVDKFERMIKSQLLSILDEDNDNFLTDFKELCVRGLACEDGWTEDFSPENFIPTEHLEWILHHQLATMRGAMVEEKLSEIKKTVNLDMFGGNLNVHVADALQCAVYPRFRTYDAEKYHQINPREMFETLWLLLINKSKQREWGILDTAFLAHEIAHVHPVLLYYTFRLSKHFQKLDQDYTVERIVTRIYDSIKPTGDKAKSAIKWEVIDRWLVKHKSTGLFEKTTIGDDEYPCLSKKGVLLLLLNYGILVPKKKIVLE